MTNEELDFSKCDYLKNLSVEDKVSLIMRTLSLMVKDVAFIKGALEMIKLRLEGLDNK